MKELHGKAHEQAGRGQVVYHRRNAEGERPGVLPAWQGFVCSPAVRQV